MIWRLTTTTEPSDNTARHCFENKNQLFFPRETSMNHKHCDIWYNFYLLWNFRWPETPLESLSGFQILLKMKLFRTLIVILLKSQTFLLAVSEFNTETIDAKLGQIYQAQANASLEFIFHYRDLEGLFTFFLNQLFFSFFFAMLKNAGTFLTK